MKSHPGSPQAQETPRFINPHRLFHGVWLPQWLEDRPEVSEKAKKLYAYLTYFAGFLATLLRAFLTQCARSSAAQNC